MTQAEETEKQHETELESQKKHAHKLDKKLSKAQKALEEAENMKRELESELKVAKESSEAEIKLKQEVNYLIQNVTFERRYMDVASTLKGWNDVVTQPAKLQKKAVWRSVFLCI